MFVAEEACSCNQEQQQQSRNSTVKDVGSIRERFRDRYCKIKEYAPSILWRFSTIKMHSSESISSFSSLYLSQLVPFSFSHSFLWSSRTELVWGMELEKTIKQNDHVTYHRCRNYVYRRVVMCIFCQGRWKAESSSSPALAPLLTSSLNTGAFTVEDRTGKRSQ